ncbi:alanine racemase [Pelagibacterium montanilacus]|uniref:alanine racemase n=1 Tax=Pelagibacterium montanilacus TaxID=2185280 RepID=UPI0013DF1310|nr:alanine racemase [Pelagibacterium montanilacus]
MSSQHYKGATPRLVLDATIMDANIAAMAGAVRARGSLALRPHFKTNKMIEVARRLMDGGAVGLTCATIAELEALIAAGITDLFWAQEPVGEAKVQAAIALNRKARVAVGLDSLAAAQPLSEAASAQGVTVPYLIEIDSGMGRAGLAADRVPALARQLDTLPGLERAGIFTHEGQLYGVADPAERARAAKAVGESMVAIAEALRGAGLDCPVVSTGSTPGGADSARVDGVTEVRPGTFVFMDANQMTIERCAEADCAVSVLATVMSRPRPGAAIIDAGLKAMSSDRAISGSGFGRIKGHPGIAFGTAYEEHGLLTGADVDRLSVGDQVEIIPNHVCGAVNMWSRALVRQNGAIVDEWSIVGRH